MRSDDGKGAEAAHTICSIAAEMQGQAHAWLLEQDAIIGGRPPDRDAQNRHAASIFALAKRAKTKARQLMAQQPLQHTGDK